ncbi:carbohydrate ABC transporter permease [Clostridium grantii]|uniref:Raffinose/stachyose/melibiose transport system permease protein n=1 Tax=Clostridium grantii DSM 8605 TaxID=1121316 RepID=A0A1M5UJE3_9CLOT|nr:carbohydrate ABC transporter permease [Clostridium grantii]SHH63125.1 raffinose/stachyose/melibiose transport system permease protein [Clostridium grantii DSM 8605]
MNNSTIDNVNLTVNPKKMKKNKEEKITVGSVISKIVLLFFMFYTLLPIVWLFISSLKTNAELIAKPFGLPKIPQFQNYINAFQVSGLGTLFVNSVIVSLCATVLNIMIASMASYVIARFEFKFKEGIFVAITAGILVPICSLMVPYFMVIKTLGLYDSKAALILTYSAVSLPISTFIIRGFMNTIPRELEEAGVIDGCNFYQRFYKIIFPLSRSGIVTAATFQFLYCWNEFIYAMLLTSSQSNRTMQVGIRYFSNQFTTDYTSMYAAIIISIIPSMIGYVLLQEQIISGLTNGAVKG